MGAPRIKIESLIGKKFGLLTVTGSPPRTPNGRLLLTCTCDCGKSHTVRHCAITGNSKRSTRSCGCAGGYHVVKDLVGRTYGRLTIMERFGTAPDGHAMWMCSCSCAPDKTTVVSSNNILTGNTRSCGCFMRERVSDARRKAPGQSGRNNLLHAYKKSAASRGHEWALTDAQFDSLTKSTCAYCGVVPRQASTSGGCTESGIRHSQYIYNGIDRVDNSLGYISSNVVPCCGVCNRAKGNMRHSDWRDYLKRISFVPARRKA